MDRLDRGDFRNRCPDCGGPKVNGRCEFAEDHAWNDEAAEDLDRDTLHLWRTR